MDNTHTSTAQHTGPAGDESDFGETSQAIFSILLSPARLFFSAISYLRPFAPQIIPVLVCISFIPLVVILSLTAGFFVWKNVAVSWEAPLYLQYGDGTPPYAMTPLPSLVSGQPYGISVQLILPPTESNLVLGNFMTTLTLTTTFNKTLISIRRPTIAFPPKTSFFSRRHDIIILDVPMVSAFTPSSSRIYAHVEVGRHDGWRSLGSGEGKEIAVISASVRGSVTHSGIRGLVSRFPFTFSVLSAATFLMILTLFLAACILPTIVQRAFQDGDTEQTENKISPSLSPSLSDSDGDELILRRLRSRAKRGRSKKSRIKREAPVTLTPSAEVMPGLLRRRRSRTSDGLTD